MLAIRGIFGPYALGNFMEINFRIHAGASSFLRLGRYETHLQAATGDRSNLGAPIL